MSTELEMHQNVALLTWYLGDEARQEHLLNVKDEQDKAWMNHFIQDTKESLHPEEKLRVIYMQVKTIEYVLPENPLPLEEIV